MNFKLKVYVDYKTHAFFLVVLNDKRTSRYFDVFSMRAVSNAIAIPIKSVANEMERK